MPTLEYDAPPGMRCQSCMWDSQAYVDIFFDHKFRSIHPESITLHPARLAPQPRISIASTGLKYQNLMEYDCMRDSSKRWKNPDFPHIPYYHIPEVFISEGGKEKDLFRFIFFFQYSSLLSGKVFLVYDPLCGVR